KPCDDGKLENSNEYQEKDNCTEALTSLNELVVHHHLQQTKPLVKSMFHQMGGVHSHQNLFMNPAASVTLEHFSNASRSSIHQSVPSYNPIFTPIQNEDDYRSFLHMSSTFSSLIVSALSQNPTAYAAASFASTLWPCANIEAPVEPSTAQIGTFQSRPISPAPSMAAIAAATVAAATACERRENNHDPGLGGQQLEPECSEALHEQHSRAKSPTLSTSDSEATEGAKLNLGLAADETEKIADAAELHDANKSKNKKQVDRSSCGSNTPSSSEVEVDALEKHTKGKEEKVMKDKEDSQGLGVIHPVGDPFSRRFRSTSNMNDSWKEVSEEGRLAFQALFCREVLPQSFSPPHDVKIKGKKNSIKDKENSEEKVENGLQLDLNGKTWAKFSEKLGVQEDPLLTGENKEDGLLNLGLGHAKLKAHRTGFKPYKRCSVEAKESRVSGNSQDDEKCPKRLRLEGETST
ncbi:UNVERIFIED_CONTAM: protein LHY, partial [Sesamum angustifolium]